MTIRLDAGPGWVQLAHRPATDTRCDRVVITTGGLVAMFNNADDLITHGESYAQACRDLAQLLPRKPRTRDDTPTLFEVSGA